MMKLKIKGPKINSQKAIWEAGFDDGVEVVEWHDGDGGHFTDQRTIRHLFLSRKETVLNGTAPANNRRKLLLPGTIIALCRINKVRVNLSNSSFVWRQSDAKVCHALLLLQAKPQDWIDGPSPNQRLKMPECVCLGGEIDLSMLEPENGDGWTAKFPSIKNAKNLKLNSGGLAFEGDCSFKWNKDKQIPAAFWTAPVFDRRTTTSPSLKDLYLTVDRERMNAEKEKRPDWKQSLKDLADAFLDLAGKLAQNKDHEPRNTYWTSLELVSRSGIPRFFWTISQTQNQTTLNFERGEWQVIVADQKPAESDVPPRGLLTIAPEIKVDDGAPDEIVVSFSQIPPNTDELRNKMTFEAKNNAGKWTETITVKDVITEYESLATADILRRQYNLTTPEAEENETEPAILWGFLPLAEGWAQLPFLNLVEQHYFDALPQEEPNAEDANDKPPLLVGAAVFGNDAPETFLPARGENSWSVTLLNGEGYRGKWVIKSNQASPPKLELSARTLEIFAPDVVLNGFLHLGTQTPSAKDNLPSLDNFLTDLQKISLRTSRADDKFPAPFRLHFSSIDFKNRRTVRGKKDFSDPILQGWQFTYQINKTLVKFKPPEPAEPVFAVLLKKGLWKKLNDKEKIRRFENIWQHLPLIWREHPQAPLVQALPLTQTQTPPSYPSTSRQLAPFEFSVDSDAPAGLMAIFGVEDSTGAQNWARWLNPRPADQNQEWGKAKFLYLAALSLPGLIFDPNSPPDLFQTTDKFLPAQLLYGLPYTDEINALAQLSKDEKNGQAISLNQDAPPVKPAPAPRREHFAEHWQTLAEKAALAKADADEILDKNKIDGKTVVQNLVEPFNWTVKAKLETDEYPAKVTLTDDVTGKGIELTEKLPDVTIPENPKKISALKGITGKFVLDGQNLRLDDGADSFEIIAQSFKAKGDGSRLRDQRGLWRGATTPIPNANAPRLLKTALERQISNGSELFALYTLMAPLTLKLNGSATWQFWFRDLPVFNSDNNFSRAKTQKQAEDVNDPAATSSEANALTGYEWRIGQTAAPVKLFGFNFFPLTLEKVSLAGDEVQSVEIIGRLQLPVEGATEFPEQGNTVKAVFSRQGGELKLSAVTSKLSDGVIPPETVCGIWNLNPQTEFFAPRLHWKKIDYPVTENPSTTNKIRLSSSLEFYLFDARWFIDMTEQTFEPGTEVTLVSVAAAAADDIVFEKVTLKLNSDLKPTELKVAIRFDWGRDAALTASANIIFDLLKADTKGGANLLEKAESIDFYWNLAGEKIRLQTDKEHSSLTKNALQIEFAGFKDDIAPEKLELLPAMTLAGNEPCTGFAAVSFTIAPKDEKSSRFELDYGAIESIFACRWGEQLPNGTANVRQTFGSSAGDLCAGFTLSGTGQGNWKTSLLLNGIVETKNLISYPRVERKLEAEAKAAMDLPQFVLFESTSSTLTASANEQLKKLAEFMAMGKYSNLHLTLEGHTDGKGNHSEGDNNNFKISKKRAEAVRDKLIGLGVAPERLQTVWFGETLPRDTNETDEGRTNNRRVEIHPSLAFLPPARPAAENLNHTRHALRVLLNQHEVPSNALVKGGKGTLFFKFSDNAAWQFLAVVEHYLADVEFDGATGARITNGRRWAAVQEVRFASPQKFSDYLGEFMHEKALPRKDRLYATFPTHKDINEFDDDNLELARVSVAFHYKPFLRPLLKKTGNQNEVTKLGNALIIEASAIQQILSRPVNSDNLTNLQYLPNGVQQAVLSLPTDYALPDSDADWFLLSLPFLGRLQNRAQDWLENTATPPNDSALAVDPLWLISKKRVSGAQPLPLLPLVLASRGDDRKIEIKFSLFDLTRFRRFKRLDQPTLLESWFRLQNPPPERTTADNENPDGLKLTSVTAALAADSPARIGRQTLLNRLFDTLRDKFPPTLSEVTGNAEVTVTDKLVWRREALLTWQGFSNLVKEEIADESEDDAPVWDRPYSFYFAAAQVQSAGFSVVLNANPQRFAAVTLLPANLQVGGNDNELPVSFAVSPYLGFELMELKDTVEEIPQLVFVELLCLDNSGKKLITAASRVWQREEMNDDFEPLVKNWGNEVKNRIAGDSALAVLRIRLAFAVDLKDKNRSLKIAYRFLTIAAAQQPSLAIEGSSPLRLPLEKLRFAEGQYGGAKMPPRFTAFEVAPPQVCGAQPIYISPEDWNASIPGERDKWRLGWQWGLSAMRFSVRYTLDQAGIIGARQEDAPTGTRTLWWNAISHRVQFAEPPEIARLLPVKFRASQIKSLPPLLPNLPLPENLEMVLDEGGELKYWQPILPGSLNYLIAGARAGVPFVFRNLLLRQDINQPNKKFAVLTAGGVPVQHRFPRPVPLPPFPPESDLVPALPTEPAPRYALQTWASYFEPRKLLLKLPNPHDNAFVVKKENEAHGLEIELMKPDGGILRTDTDGKFWLQINGQSATAQPTELANWKFSAVITANERKLNLLPMRPSLTDDCCFRFEPENGIEGMRQFLNGLPQGTALLLALKVIPDGKLTDIDNNDYSQTLNFPLRLAYADRMREPFRYEFVQFEDPEYNRRLVSQAAQTSRTIFINQKSVEQVFAADRREYNASSDILLAFFSQILQVGTVTVKRVDIDGNQTVLADKMAMKSFLIFPLSVFTGVVAGDSLLILFQPDDTSIKPMELRVEIVAEPVTPVPTAAYALLRQKKGELAVKCVRFAWSPQPARIELLNPADLRDGIVRRRAIFQWTDTVRSECGENGNELLANYSYAIQKISPSGSTHFPRFANPES